LITEYNLLTLLGIIMIHGQLTIQYLLHAKVIATKPSLPAL
jgi:hypothetical protein